MAKKFTKLVAGGAQLPDLANPASTSEIFNSKEAIDQSGNKITGTFTIENELSTQEDLISQISTLVAQKANPSGGVELPDLTNPAAASDILSGKEAIDENGNVMTGTIATKTSSNLTASGATVTVPAGYYANNATKSVATATQATPSVSIDANGKISASATQTAGYVAAGTKTGTKQLTTQAAKTITPSTSSQTAVAKNVYTTGVVTVGAIPSSYENVAAETTEYTSLISELTTAVSALESELEGKASGGGSGSVDTCMVTFDYYDMEESDLDDCFIAYTDENSTIISKTLRELEVSLSGGGYVVGGTVYPKIGTIFYSSCPFVVATGECTVLDLCAIIVNGDCYFST